MGAVPIFPTTISAALLANSTATSKFKLFAKA